MGTSPGATLYIVQVLTSSGSGSLSGILCGYDWVAQRASANDLPVPIKVLSASLGGAYVSTQQRDAIANLANLGVVTVVAAGNDNANFNGYSPAWVPEALTVTAVDDANGAPGGVCSEDGPAGFSNWLPVGHAKSATTIAAPGVNVLSTMPGPGFAYMSGKSVARHARAHTRTGWQICRTPRAGLHVGRLLCHAA